MNSSRIKLLEKHEAPESLSAIYDKADAAMTNGAMPGPTLFGNQVRALAHNPELLESLLRVYEAFAATASLERKLVELGILIVSRVNACEYCVQHHAPLAHEAGLTAEQLTVIQKGTWLESKDLWSKEEWLVIAYAEKLTREPYKISNAFFTEFKACFSDRQISDLTMRLALCSAWNKFNDVLQLDTESPVQHAFSELKLETKD